jgi:hypothetical protein
MNEPQKDDVLFALAFIIAVGVGTYFMLDHIREALTGMPIHQIFRR